MQPTRSLTQKSNSTSWLWRFHQNHERLKRAVHEGMRIPLPPWGRRFMGFVYFTIPIVGGYYVMQWAIGKAHKSIGPNGEFLPNKDVPIGSSSSSSDSSTRHPPVPTLGVPLASSDAETQQKNKIKLERFLRQQFKDQQQQQQQQQKLSKVDSNENRASS